MGPSNCNNRCRACHAITTAAKTYALDSEIDTRCGVCSTKHPSATVICESRNTLTDTGTTGTCVTLDSDSVRRVGLAVYSECGGASRRRRMTVDGGCVGRAASCGSIHARGSSAGGICASCDGRCRCARSDNVELRAWRLRSDSDPFRALVDRRVTDCFHACP